MPRPERPPIPDGVFHVTARGVTALPLWLNHYNHTRPHGSLGHRPPASRLNNVSRNYT